jgi:hypothetical protein
MLNIIMLSIIRLSIIMKSIIMLNIIVLSIVGQIFVMLIIIILEKGQGHIHNTSLTSQLTNDPTKLERYFTLSGKGLLGRNTVAYCAH